MKPGKTTGKPALPVICDRIRYYREKRKLEQKAMANMIGITPNTISNWENGRARPDVNLLPAICRTLDITLYDLFGLKNPAPAYTDRQKNLVEHYSRMNGGHQFAVDQLILSLLKAEDAESCPDLRCKLFFERGLAAGAGDPTEIEDRGTPVYLYATPETDRADYVFTVNGNSMEPDFRNGDMVLVQKSSGKEDMIRPGEIGAFIFGNEMYIKEYRQDGLHSLNPSYQTMKFSDADRVYLIGRVLGVLDPKFIASAADVERYEAMNGKPQEQFGNGRR